MAIRDVIKGLFKSKKNYEAKGTEVDAVIGDKDNIATASCFDTPDCDIVEIDYCEYDAENICSVYKYALLKYGKGIINNPQRFKNILSDLAPHLIKEIKLLSCLCNSGKVSKLAVLKNTDVSDCVLWVNNATNYLVHEEVIDELVAYEFCVNLIIEIVGADIPKDYLDKNKSELQYKEDVNKQKVKERIEQATEILRQKQELVKEFELEEMRKRLAVEEQARLNAEEQLERERKTFSDIQKQIQEATAKELGNLYALLNQYKNSSNQVLVDYNEQSSILELFTKYNGLIEGNIIVVDVGWSGDFCFVVDEIIQKQGLKARGTLYKDGEFYRNYTYPADNYMYKMYSGDSRDRINNVHLKRSTDLSVKVVHKSNPVKNKRDNVLIMPDGVGEYTSIEKIKNANPGKRIIVVKQGWSNDYCFCVEGFEGQVKAVGTRFLDGKPRAKDWVDRRHRKFKVYNGPSKEKIEEYYQQTDVN